MRSNVLIVETDLSTRERVEAAFEDVNMSITTAASQLDGLHQLADHEFDVLVTELPQSCAASVRLALDSSAGQIAPHACELETTATRTAAALRWIAEVRRAAPHTPIVLITREGMESVAYEVLLRGATSFVPLKRVEELLSNTVELVLQVSRHCQHAKDVNQCVSRVKFELSVPSDESLVPSIIAKLENAIEPLDLFDEMIWTQVAMALDEAILNAMIHGNLEVDSTLREINDGQGYWDEIKSRRELAPYRDRRTNIILTATRAQAVFVVKDQGPGFDLNSLPDPNDPANLESIGGRGMMLITAFMDEIHHNDAGNELTMIKRKDAGPRED